MKRLDLLLLVLVMGYLFLTSPQADASDQTTSNITSAKLTAKPQPGWYFIQSSVSGLYLDVPGASRKCGTSIVQARQDNRQVWKLIPAGGDWFYIQSGVSQLNLDVYQGKAEIGTPVDQAKQHSQQVWKFIPARDCPPGGDCYYIQSNVRLPSNGLELYLDICQACQDEGAPVAVAQYHPKQVWKLFPAPPRDLVYIGVDDDDCNGPFAGFLDKPEDWQFVRQHVDGYYISNIALEGLKNHSLKLPKGCGIDNYDLSERLQRLANLFTNKNVFYETDCGSSLEEDEENINLLLKYFNKGTYASIGYVQCIPESDQPTRLQALRNAGLRPDEPRRPVLTMQAPRSIGGDINSGGTCKNCICRKEKCKEGDCSSLNFAAVTKEWIDATDGSATDSPMGMWHENYDRMKTGSYSMVNYSRSSGKLAMVMLASFSGYPKPKEQQLEEYQFLAYGRECVTEHEDSIATPNIWAISNYNAHEQKIRVTPEQVNGEPVGTVTGMAYWLIHHLQEPRTACGSDTPVFPRCDDYHCSHPK